MATAVTATAGAVGFRVLGTRWARGERFDLSSVQDGLTQLASPRVHQATATLLDTITVSSLAVIGGSLVLVAALRGRPDLAAACAAVLVGANATTELLKAELEPRTNVPEGLSRSFPSGHATVALSLGLALLLVLPPALRVAGAVVAAGYAAVVGVALVVAGWHFPSDVGGGYCVATAWAAAGALLVRRAPTGRPPLWLLVAACVLVALAAGAAVLVHPGLAVRISLHRRLVEAAGGIVAVAAGWTAVYTCAISE